jgi:microcystin degradation protein MlrC
VSADLKRKVQSFEQQSGVLAAGIATVQPWLDIPEFGSAVLVTTDHEPELARQLAADLANTLWSRRREFLPELWSIEDAVAQAHANQTGRVVVLSDAADATTSGAPGDSVWILREILKYDWPRPALVTLVSPELVYELQSLPPGEPVTVSLGGVRDNRFGTTIHFSGQIESTFDARFQLNGHLGKNLPIDMGRSVVLRRGNVFVLITTLSGPHFAPELFQTAGFDPFTASILIAKSPIGFRAVYTAPAAAIYSVRSRGCAPTDFWNYPFEQIQHPLWPWDEFEFTA